MTNDEIADECFGIECDTKDNGSEETADKEEKDTDDKNEEAEQADFS